MNIPRWPVWGDREAELLQEVLAAERWGGYNDFVPRLEREFASFQHCDWGIAAMNGTVTLEMALEAAGVRPGDEVIVPAISFISTATAVSRVGATPVFVDIEPLSFNMDPERAAAAVSPLTRAVIVVHFGGAMADMDRLGALADDRGLALIEDAAHAHGSEWGGRRAGSLGLAGSFSFQNSKVMTAGEGGMLTGNDADFAARARSIADQGRRPGGGWFHHYTLGTNYRITAWQAAVLLAQLERLPEQICLRARHAGCCNAKPQGWRGYAGRSFPLVRPPIPGTSCWAASTPPASAVPATSSSAPWWRLECHAHPSTRTRSTATRSTAAGAAGWSPCPVAEETIGDAFWFPHRVLMASDGDIGEIAALILRTAASRP